MSKTTKVSSDDINQIISNTLAKNVASNSQSFAQSTIVNQSSVNSTNCTNVAVTSSTMIVKADTTVFQDTDVYQKSVTDIMNQITTAIDQESEGLGILSDDQLAEITNAIQNTVETNLTAEVLDINNNAASSSIIVNQSCTDSSDSLNFYYGTETQVVSLYTESYSSLSAVQSTSATISNLTDSDVTQKSEGTLVAIAKALVEIVLFVVIAVIAIGVVIVITLFAFGLI